MYKVKFLKRDPKAVLPFKTYKSDACFDVVATSRKDYGDGRISYTFGLSFDLPRGTRLDMRSRSSIHKTGLVLSNSIATIDETFTGEISAVFYHVLPALPAYEVGDKILQIHLETRLPVEFEETDSIAEKERGQNSYGSTGR